MKTMFGFDWAHADSWPNEMIAATDPPRWESLLAWHRYTFAGAALNDRRLLS